MRAHIRLGSIRGIRIGLHASWFLIALLIGLSLAQYFHVVQPSWPPVVIWGSALATVLLFFATLLLHELSHAMVARRRGLPVESITLFALGGIAHIGKDAGDAKTEFWMGIVGPITSAVIGFVCLALARAWGSETATPPAAILTWLGRINLWLAIFNMVPGFPLDGGRVLRAVVWWATGDAHRATRIAAHVGQVVALGLIAIGAIGFFMGTGFESLWLALVGWFLLEAARASALQVQVLTDLRGVRVGDVMNHEIPSVDRHTTLQDFAEGQLLRTGSRCYFVQENGGAAGLVTPRDLAGVDRARWPETTVEEVMRPLHDLRTVTPETPVAQALQAMWREDLNQLPVVSHDHFEGVVSRGQVMQLLRTRNELNL